MTPHLERMQDIVAEMWTCIFPPWRWLRWNRLRREWHREHRLHLAELEQRRQRFADHQATCERLTRRHGG